MVTRKVRRRPVTTDLDSEVGDYLLNRSTRERAEHQEGQYKVRFMALLAEVGELQEGEHRVIWLNEPLLFSSYKGGKLKEKTVTGIQRQYRKGTKVLNEERTLSYLANNGLLDACTRTITVIDEDAVLGANFMGTVSDEDLESLYDTSDPTYAFYLVEGTESEG